MDITKCHGKDCKKKDRCYRHTGKSGFRQSWFMESPIKDGECEYFLNNDKKEKK